MGEWVVLAPCLANSRTWPGGVARAAATDGTSMEVATAPLLGHSGPVCEACVGKGAVYNVHCTVYTVQCTVYTVQCTECSVHCTV